MQATTKNICDQQLMQQICQGNEKALSQIIDRYMHDVFRMSYHLLDDTAKAEDITQDTFITLWDKPEKWQPSGTLKSWLLRIARNKSIDEIRKRKLQINIEDTNIESNDIKQDAHIFNREISTLLHMHVKALPERQCEAITIVHFLECSNTEAASIMNISVNALESLLARGRRKLRLSLKNNKDIIKGEI